MDWAAVSVVISLAGFFGGLTLFLVKVGKFIQVVESLEDKMNQRFVSMEDKMNQRFVHLENKVEEFRKETRDELKGIKDEIKDLSSKLSRLEGKEEVSQSVLLSVVRRQNLEDDFKAKGS